MLTGSLVLEAFDYKVGDAEYPVFGADGEPLFDDDDNQRTESFTSLFVSPSPGVAIELRMRSDQWKEFARKVGMERVALPTFDESRRFGKTPDSPS